MYDRQSTNHISSKSTDVGGGGILSTVSRSQTLAQPDSPLYNFISMGYARLHYPCCYAKSPTAQDTFRPIPGLISVFTMRRGERSRFQAYVHSRLPSLGTRLTHDVMFTQAKTGARLFQTITEHFSSLGRSSHGFYPHSGHRRE